MDEKRGREARTEERRRHDTIIAQLTRRVPELEATNEQPQDVAQDTGEDSGKGTAPREPEKGVQRRSWLRRWMG